MTGRDLVTRALRTIGVVGAGEVLTAAEAADALTICNAMLDGWRADRLLVDHITRNTFTSTNGVAEYTIGPTGDWTYDSVPTWIDAAGVILPDSDPNIETPLAILTPQRWEAVSLKSESLTPAIGIYYTRTSSTVGTVRVYPVPDRTQTIVLYLLAPLGADIDLDTVLALPSGYQDAITYNLATRAALEWGRPVDPALTNLAATTLALIKSANVQPNELTTDRALWAQPGRGWGRAAFDRGY